MARFLFIALALTWGSSFILMKVAMTSFGPLAVGGYRLLGGLKWRRATAISASANLVTIAASFLLTP